MGANISMGPAFRYVFNKQQFSQALTRSWICHRTETEIRSELARNFASELYTLSEDDEWMMFSLSEKIPALDFIELYDGFNELLYRHELKKERVKHIRNEISGMKGLLDIERYCSENPNVNFRPFELPSYAHQHYFSMFGETVFAPTGITGISLYIGNCKTSSESDTESFDLFTDFLRFRLKHLKLADSLLVFLTL